MGLHAVKLTMPIEQIHADGIVYTRIEGEASIAPIGPAYLSGLSLGNGPKLRRPTKKTGTAFRARADVTLAGGWTTVALP